MGVCLASRLSSTALGTHTPVSYLPAHEKGIFMHTSSKKRIFRMIPFALLLPAVLALSTTHASAATSYLLRNNGSGDCLDSNASGNAYLNPCDSGNNFQRWEFVNANWGALLKDVATGRCLDSNASGSVYTNPCSTGNAYQNWVQPSGNYYKNVATGLCLRVGGNYLDEARTQSCGTSSYFSWTRL
ncbi:ricin-type beta-trefoil lectin domain protein [Microbispora cellulosiformans]|uniref:Ricin-type beta-trefoil lectin domain protein n=2 Tax=Microbispora cellulosiformans TaxID=2614688 RepID=A0A5J5K892_9ACTN|nr:ricin-type beta-trefoil lectin domain protein [Microbispora cellulosiformans]